MLYLAPSNYVRYDVRQWRARNRSDRSERLFRCLVSIMGCLIELCLIWLIIIKGLGDTTYHACPVQVEEGVVERCIRERYSHLALSSGGKGNVDKSSVVLSPLLCTSAHPQCSRARSRQDLIVKKRCREAITMQVKVRFDPCSILPAFGGSTSPSFRSSALPRSR